ncbi:hypothetical protein GP486_000772 [Trichoglossum hirsutum]|uniref:DUF2293 domain-containing protein n=1 Tax=Trichoglossum hirsutum TaxID=265104 RepID=A0A9P8LIE4_9PEZI|nr:hypothetical protein GP486_000772 [Trichoglossum hirsutum]
MARVKPSTSGSMATRSSSALKTRPYKVVYEAIAQEKKKLLTVLSFSQQAPLGFTFVPAGIPELTARCKEYSRVRECKVFVVSTSHQKARNITQHVCRIGHHFASSIVSKACSELGISTSPAGCIRDSQNINVDSTPEAISAHYIKPKRGVNFLPGKEAHVKLDLISQEQLNHEARNALTDLFPKIPERDLIAIISRAFRKGGGRVGNAHGLSLQYRVQLATVAHIRHQYTMYDKLIRAMPRREARAQVEEPCLRLIVQWRGDEENDENDIEEILREVIVITDDDADDDYHEDNEKNAQPERGPSVRITSNQPINQELQKNQISQNFAAGDDYPVISNTAALGSVENTPVRVPGRQKHKNPSTKWSDRYRKFRDEFNKRDRQVEDQRHMHTVYGLREQGRNDDREGNLRRGFLSPFLHRYGLLPHNSNFLNLCCGPWKPSLLTKLDSSRELEPVVIPDDTKPRDQVWDTGRPTREQIYREMITPVAYATDDIYGKRDATDTLYTEVKKINDRPNTFDQPSQFYGQDIIRPSIENSLNIPIRPINEDQQERHYYGPFHQLAERQIEALSSEKHEKVSHMGDLPRLHTPFSRPRTFPACAELDRDEQSRKRRRMQYEPVVIPPQRDATESSRSPLVEHSGSDDLPRPPLPYFEQPMREQTPLRLGSQSHQLSGSAPPEFHVRGFKELASPGKHNFGIYYKSHDRISQRSGFHSGECQAQLQPPDYTQIYQQSLRGSLNVPHSRDDKRPTFVGDDQSIAAWGRLRNHLSPGNNPVYRPQDTDLKRTPFHPYFESHRDVPHESRRFEPYYLKPTHDNQKPHGQSLNFQPELGPLSFREPPRFQTNACLNSWSVSCEDEPTLVRRQVLDELPNGQNVLDGIGAECLLSDSAFRRVSVPTPSVNARRLSRLDLPFGGVRAMTGNMRDVYQECTDNPPDRYYRQSVCPIYVEQPSGDFQLERRDHNRFSPRKEHIPNEDIIIVD